MYINLIFLYALQKPDEKCLDDLVTNLKQKLDDCKRASDHLKSINASKPEIGAAQASLSEAIDSLAKLEELIEFKQNEANKAKFSELNDLQKEFTHMDETLEDIQIFLSADTQSNANSETLNEDDLLEAKKNRLNDIKHTLGHLNEQLKNASDNLNNHLNLSEVDMNNDSTKILKQLQETVRNLTEKCAHLNALQKKEEDSINEQSYLLNQLNAQIAQCNDAIVKCTQDFDAKTKSISVALETSTNSASIGSLVAEHEKDEELYLRPIRQSLDEINRQSSELFHVNSNKRLSQPDMLPESINVIQMTSLELKLEKLNNNFAKLDGLFNERAKQLDLALFKSAKFEDKIKTLHQHLEQVELKLQDKVLFSFDNLNTIDDHLSVCSELINQLVHTSTEIDDFKEICEKIMQNCENSQERDIVEKRMDNIIYKWNILTRQLDEKYTNLTFLNLHLNELNLKYIEGKSFVDELNLKYTSNLTLNCVEPIVIKCQYEKMRELNNTVDEHFFLISELKSDTANLLSMQRDYDRLSDEYDDEGANKYLAHLPKTISSGAVHALVSLLDKQDLDTKVEDINAKYTEYKMSLSKNLSLMHSLYPLCEKFSHTIVQLNQSFGKFESELVWLHSSNDNETSPKEKEALFAEVKRGILDNEDIISNLEGPLSARIIDEFNTLDEDSLQNANFCDEFIQDLNANINQVRIHVQ